MAGNFILRHQLGDVLFSWGTEIIRDWNALGPEQKEMRFRQLVFGEGLGISHAFGENELCLIVDL